MNISTPNDRRIRWLYELMEYNFDIRHIARTSNVMADRLSNAYNDEEPQDCMMIYTEEDYKDELPKIIESLQNSRFLAR